MYARLDSARRYYHSTLDSGQLRIVKVIAWLSVIAVVGLTISGVWQFFAHESDPAWFDHIPGSEGRQPISPSTGVAEVHNTFATFAGVVALFGGGWYAYKVIFDVPRFAPFAFAMIFVGSLTGGIVRFNAIKVDGRSYEDAGAGYGQIFTDDIEFVVTDRWDLGATAIRLLTASHLLILPVLLAAAWFSLPTMKKAARPSRSASDRRPTRV